jgi:hypothetical protein
MKETERVLGSHRLWAVIHVIKINWNCKEAPIHPIIRSRTVIISQAHPLTRDNIFEGKSPPYNCVHPDVMISFPRFCFQQVMRTIIAIHETSLNTKYFQRVLFSGIIKPCSPLKVNRRFGGTCRLHLQGRSICSACYLLHARFLVLLVFDVEDGDMFLWNVRLHDVLSRR